MRVAVYLALASAVSGFIEVNERIARRRGDRIIAALRAYKARHGTYPRALAALVPELLPSVPIAKFTLMSSEFRYGYDPEGDDAILWYASALDFGRPFYRLNGDRWSYMD